MGERKRNRTTYVCTFCKRRKIRCDKGSPCSGCVKYNNPVCEYAPEARRSDDSLEENGLSEKLKSRRTSLMASGAASVPDTVVSELEMLRNKILILEASVKSTSPEDPNAPVWSGPDMDDSLYLLGLNPYASETETFSFHSRYSPFLSIGASSSRHFGPLSWVLLIKIDNAISEMFNYKHDCMVKQRKDYHNAYAQDDKPAELVFAKKIADSGFLNEQALFSESAKTSPSDIHGIRLKINERAKAVGLTFYEGGFDAELELIDKIELLLPVRNVMWLLIERFFKRVYVFFPFLDELDFKEKISRIVGPPSTLHEKVAKLNVDKKIDLVYLGTLLLVLRFAYLTLFTNSETINESNLRTSDPSPRAQEIKYLLSNPIDIDFLEVAELCFHQFSFLRMCNLPLLQLALYIKLYYLFAPENGEVPEESHSQSYTAMLINMAISLGLHREPDNYKDTLRSEKTNNLCRKIWYYLLVLDFQGAMSNGIPVCTNREMFDTKPPFHKPGNENLVDFEIEKLVIAAYCNIGSNYEPLWRLVSLIASVNKPIQMPDLCAQLSHLELFFIKDFKHFRCDIVEPWSIEGLKKKVDTKIYFQASFFLVSVCFHFFNNYESEGNMDLAYFYLKKLLVVSVHNLMPFYEDFVEKSNELFQDSTDITVTPGFQSLVHKCIIVLQAVMARVRFSLLQLDGQSSHLTSMARDPEYRLRYELLEETYDLSNKCLRVFLVTLTKLSSRYYYSWRCVKAQEHLRLTRTGTAYYLDWCKGKEGYMKLSNPMLQDLNRLLARSLDRVQQNRNSMVNNLSITREELFQVPESSDITDTDDYNGDLFSNKGDVDKLWMLMMSTKPHSKNTFYTHTPPAMDIDLSLGTFEQLTFGSFGESGHFGVETALGGLNFLEPSSFDELVKQTQ